MTFLGRVLNLTGSAGAEAHPPVVYDGASNLQLPVLSGSGPERNMRAYSSVGILFAIVNRLANATAKTEWCLYRKAVTSEGERTKVTSHAAIDLVEKPNPFYRRRRLMESGQQHIDLTGEGWIVLGFAGSNRSLPIEMWVVRPDRMAPVPHPTRFISGYVYTAPNGVQVPFETWEVIPLQMPNPLDPYRGLGPVQSVLTDLDASKYSAEWNRNFFINSAQPGGIIEVPEALSDPEFDRLRLRWNEQHRGVRKAHHVAILEHGKWVPVGYTMRDMQFAQLREVSRDTILEAFAMHKQNVGISDDVNRANALAGEQSFGRWHMVPRLDMWKEALDTLTYRFYDPSETLEWDYENPVPPDLEDERADLTARVDALIKLLGQNVAMDEACRVVGLPEMTQLGTDGGTLTPDAQALFCQKLYLAVGTLLTWEEARALAQKAGIELDLSIPAPSAPVSPAVGAQGVTAPPEGGAVPATAARLDRPPLAAADRDPVAALDLRNSLRREQPVRLQLEPGEVDMEPVRGDHAEELATVLAAWGPITDAWRADLVAEIETLIDDGAVAELNALAVDSGDATAELESALNRLAARSADRVVEEADAQGVSVDPADPDGEVLGTVASLTAGTLGAAYAMSAGREAARLWAPGASGRSVASSVDDFLKTLTDAQPAEQLGGALHGAVNAARTDTLAGAPKCSVYATEVMDTATCSPCKRIDGKFLGYNTNTADLRYVREVYPYGGYRDCQGRSRCRGTVVGVWA